MNNRIKIYDNSVLTHDFEYCLRESDGKKCWYDHVTGEIYPEPDKGYDSVIYLDKGTQYIDIGCQPTIDPFTHGYWDREKGIHECSVCGYWNRNFFDLDCNYCPSCGAKMDAKTE